MSTHTPGPWHVSLPDETLILGPDRRLVATTLQDEEDYQEHFDRRAADAALIAAAPDLRDVAAAFSIKEEGGRVWLHVSGERLVGFDAEDEDAAPLVNKLRRLGQMRRAAIAKATHPSASRGDSESNPSRRQT